jgi:hypothetical protein
MIKHRHPNLFLVAAAATAFVAIPVVAAPAHAATKSVKAVEMAKPAQAAKSAGEVVAYKDLETRVGAEIAIETTLNTVRRGTLLKYTNPALTIQLGPEHGSIELSVPVETVRRVTIVAPAEPIAPPQGNSSAKKN